jgi:hypothetical protein
MNPKTAGVADAIVNWTPERKRSHLVSTLQKRGRHMTAALILQAPPEAIDQLWFEILEETERQHPK